MQHETLKSQFTDTPQLWTKHKIRGIRVVSATKTSSPDTNGLAAQLRRTRLIRRPSATTTPAQSPAPRGHAHHESRKGHRREDYSEWRLTVKKVGPDRLELSTSVLSGLRSNHLSYGPKEEKGPWLTLPPSICRPPPSVNESGPLPDTLTLTPAPLSASLKVVAGRGLTPQGRPCFSFSAPDSSP